MRKTAAKLGIMVVVMTLATTIWAYSAEFSRMDSRIKAKVDKLDFIRMEGKIDLIICYMDKKRCLRR